MKKYVVAIVGMCGAGKSVVSDELVKKGFGYVRFGQITLDEIKKKGLEVNEKNERAVREGLRKKYGMAAFAILNIPKIDNQLKSEKNKGVIADGLYSWSEYKILKERYGNRLVVLAVYASPETRYERLIKRKIEKGDKDIRFRKIARKDAISRDYSEIENIEKGGPIAMADYTIVNEYSHRELKSNTNKFLRRLEKKR